MHSEETEAACDGDARRMDEYAASWGGERTSSPTMARKRRGTMTPSFSGSSKQLERCPDVPVEHEIVLCSPNDEQKCLETLVEMKPTKPRHVSPETASSATSPRVQKEPPQRKANVVSTKVRYVSPEPGSIATSPRFHQKPPLRMVEMTPRKFIYGSDTLRQMCWRCPVVHKVFKQPEIQASASIEGLQIEMEASPEHSNSTASPVCQQNPQGMIATMISNKRRCVCVIVKEFYQNQHMVPLNENKPQDISSTSRETPHIKTEGIQAQRVS
ncbi:uncharacterized protein LOC106022288 isoform X2 [Mesocricetus auratus]|uniref:Uncharacterized protein LOC106022288 isoform X2 n=1 Tax=Mesocricetus auratus TaxID=10036 RepID=A0ABM2Y8F0_MESAU|nr:uncharacterized protein LOC106022288 isoform X2 [Mesocricetus auratus]